MTMTEQWEVIHRPAWHVCVGRYWDAEPCEDAADWYLRSVESTETDGPYCERHARFQAEMQNRESA